MRSANPSLRAFERAGQAIGQAAMTIQGTINKTAISLVILLLTASWTWQSAAGGYISPLVWVGALCGFIVAMVTVFNARWAPVTAPVYAALEGLFIGGISALFERQYPGLVINAVTLTFATLFMMLFLYRTGIIRVTDKLRTGIVAATGGICLIYLVSFIMSFFGAGIPLIHSSGTFGILFSVFVVAVAALNLVLDFDVIERGASSGAPKFMEWYGAFALMVTLIWLYIEILRLLAKLRGRR